MTPTTRLQTRPRMRQETTLATCLLTRPRMRPEIRATSSLTQLQMILAISEGADCIDEVYGD